MRPVSARLPRAVLPLLLAASGLVALAPGGAVARAADGAAEGGTASRTYVVDPVPPGLDAPGPDAPGPATSAAPSSARASRAALASTFELHSLPGSRRTIFLDVDGHVVSDTDWNAPPIRMPDAEHPAWDPAGDGPSFSAGELAAVRDVWARVAEDYAPFDVDVTTADPGEAAITRNGSGDQVYGTRVLISPSALAVEEICGGPCGGVAFIDVVDEPSDHAVLQPAWVFPHELMDDPKAVAEAASHEVGHQLGLEHDGQGGTDYYEGHASWAPIMGAGYSLPITQWSRGDYTSASNREDDLAIITSSGAPYRADEAGGTVAGAGTTLPTDAPAYVSRRDDVDVWDLGTCAGTVAVAGTVADVSPNLDLRLRLLDAAGAELASADPRSAVVGFDTATGLDASVSRAGLPEARYLVEVDGVGNGSPATGYDDYGSLGAYRLRVTGCESAPAQPPGAPDRAGVVRDAAARTATLTWSAPVDGGPVDGYEVRLDGGAWVAPTGALSHTWSGISPGAHVADLRALGAEEAGPLVTLRLAPLRAPGAPLIGTASPGPRGGELTAIARWRPPTDAGSARVDGYRVTVQRLDAAGRVVGSRTSPLLRAGVRAVSVRLTAGRYRFVVRARSVVGLGPASARSAVVRPR